MIINKNQNKKILIFLLSIFPIALISGPVLPEIYCFFLLFYFIFNFKNILKFHEKKFLIFFFVIYISINLSSFYSPDIIFSLEKSLPLFRVFFFSLCLVFFLIEHEELKIYFFYVITIIIIILFLDSIIQTSYGRNITGLKLDVTGRASSFFGDELIMGGYVVKILSVNLCLISLVKKNFFSRYILVVIILAFITILLSGERTATIQFFGLIIIYIFVYFNFTKLILFISSIILIFFSFSNLGNKSSERIFSQTIYQFNQTNNILYPSYRHYMHYHTAIQIFLENKLFGNGIKSFRILCHKDKYLKNIALNIPQHYIIKKNFDGFLKGNIDNKKNKKIFFYKNNKFHSFENLQYPLYFFNHTYNENNFSDDYVKDIFINFKKNEPIYVKFDLRGRCNTHPHNIYLQILSETGLIGFLLFMIIFFNISKIIILLSLKKIKKKLLEIEKSQLIINSSLMIFLFPIIPHPSLFNNWSLIFLSFIFSFKIYTGIKNKTNN